MDKASRKERGQKNAPVNTSTSPIFGAQVMPQPAGNHTQPPKGVILHQSVTTTQMREGPIPQASELAAYNQIMPGLAEKIVGWADTQIAHRHALEDAITKSDNEHLRSSDRDAHLGLWFGFFIAIGGLTVAGILGWRGSPVASAILGTAMLGGLVSTFVYGSKNKRPPEKQRDSPKSPSNLFTPPK